jgi:hypothetical protein
VQLISVVQVFQVLYFAQMETELRSPFLLLASMLVALQLSDFQKDLMPLFQLVSA